MSTPEGPAAKPVRFGIVGSNFIVDFFIASARKVENLSVVALYSRTEQRAKAFAAKHSIPQTFTSLRALAQSDSVDAVYVASPTSCHAEQSILFLSHGKHVLCEKPAASNARELQAVLSAAKASGKVFMEAMRSVFTPNFAECRRQMSLQGDESKVGRCHHFFGSFCQLSSRWPAYLRGEKPNAFLPDLSNGALMDLGCYAVVAAIAVFGPPEKVEYKAQLLATGVDGSGVLVLEYENGLTATLLISKQSHSFNQSEFQGEKATLRIGELGSFRALSLQAKGQSEATDVSVKDVDYSNLNTLYEVEAFAHTVQLGEAGEHPSMPWRLSLQCMKVLDRARESAGIRFPMDRRSNAELQQAVAQLK